MSEVSKTRFLEDFTAPELAALEAQYAAKVVRTQEVGWFNRHFVEDQNIYYCNYCGWPTKITGRTKVFKRGLQKLFISEARKHLETRHKEKLMACMEHRCIACGRAALDNSLSPPTECYGCGTHNFKSEFDEPNAEEDVPHDYRDEYEFELGREG